MHRRYVGAVVGGNGFKVVDGRNHLGGDAVLFRRHAQQHLQQFDNRRSVAVLPRFFQRRQRLGIARKPALQLWIDFGPELGVRKCSAQLTIHYTPDALVGRQVAAVVNFPPRQIGKFMSQVLTLGFPDPDGAVVLVTPDKPVPNGARLF